MKVPLFVRVLSLASYRFLYSILMIAHIPYSSRYIPFDTEISLFNKQAKGSVPAKGNKPSKGRN